MRVTGDMLSSSQQNSSSHGLDLKSLLTMLEVCIVSYRVSFFYSDLWPKHTMTFHNLHYRQQTGFVRCLLNLWAQMEEEDFNSNQTSMGHAAIYGLLLTNHRVCTNWEYNNKVECLKTNWGRKVLDKHKISVLLANFKPLMTPYLSSSVSGTLL